MKNKVLIKIISLEFDTSFDLFIPVNEVVWKIKKMILKSISDLSNVSLSLDSQVLMMNKETSKIYGDNEIIINTDIRNGTELVFLVRT